MQGGFQKILEHLSQLFYPKNCECCNNWLSQGEESLCLHCETELPRTNFLFDDNNIAHQRFWGRVPIAHASSFVYFTKEGMMQHLMHRLKYRNRKELGRYLGRLLGRKLQESPALQEVNCIVPVPLHIIKQGKRGYNQAELIAQGIATTTPLPVYQKQLIRIKNTASQTKMTRLQRLENVQGVFAVHQPQVLEGKHILLVDDVLTTGATLEEAAQTLLKIPGTKVSIATLGLAID
jgi:ComF family protein